MTINDDLAAVLALVNSRDPVDLSEVNMECRVFLRTHADALQAMAANDRRYRWLRGEVSTPIPLNRPVIYVEEQDPNCGDCLDTFVLSDEDADAAIDAAMQERSHDEG